MNSEDMYNQDLNYDPLFDDLIISPEQREFFKNTKVRDNKDELLVVYHGTIENFKIFDKSKIKTGSAGGDGFYFTPIRSDAIMYSMHEGATHNLMCCFLNIIHPFIFRYHTDFNKINDMYKLAYNKHMKFEEYLKSLGYDGIFLTEYSSETIYIAFEPNQIKSIFNKNPSNSDNIYESKQNNLRYPKDVKEIKNLNEFIRKAKELETDKYWSNILYDCSSANYADWTRKESRLKWKREIIQKYLDYKNNKLEEKTQTRLVDMNKLPYIEQELECRAESEYYKKILDKYNTSKTKRIKLTYSELDDIAALYEDDENYNKISNILYGTKIEEKASIDWNNYLTPEEVKKFLSKDDKVESAENIIYSKEFAPRYKDLHNPLQAKYKNSWTRKELVQDLNEFYNFGHLITEDLEKINKYDFSTKENVISFINNLSYKDATDLYKELVSDKADRVKGNRKKLSIEVVRESNLSEVKTAIFHWFLYKSPQVIYHYTNIDKFIKIKNENSLKANEEHLICCSGKSDFMNFDNNANIVRFTIYTTALPSNIFVRRNDKLDNVEYEDEWDIDFTNSAEKELKLDTLNLFKIDYSPALQRNNYISNKLKQKLKQNNLLVESLSNKLILYHNTLNTNAIKINKEGIKRGMRLKAYSVSPEEGSGIWCSNKRGYGYGYGGATITFEIDKNDKALWKANDTEYVVYRDIKPDEIIDIDLVICTLSMNSERRDHINSTVESDIPALIKDWGKEELLEIFSRYTNHIPQPYNMEQIKHLIETGKKYCKGVIKLNENTVKNIPSKYQFMVKDMYKGGDGYWNIDLADGFENNDGTTYIWDKTKRGCLEVLDSLYQAYKKSNKITESKHKIEEKSRNELLAKTKSQTITRYNKAQEYKGFYIRGVDTDELLKKDSLLTINCQVGNYRDQVQMENMLYWVEYEIEERNHDLQVTSKYITQALMDAIDGMNIKVNCECGDWKYRMAYQATKFRL